MNKFYFLLLSLSTLLLSCSQGTNRDPVDISEKIETKKQFSIKDKEYVARRCIDTTFAQGVTDSLYGLDCIQDKKIVIRTSYKGDSVATSKAINGMVLEKELDFINKVYKPETYRILENNADDKYIPFLKDFLPLPKRGENERFLGALDTKYKIVFKTVGNFLVLYKASEELKDIPYTERTSLVEEDGLFMVPFLGYPIQYCEPEFIENAQGEKTYQSRTNCHQGYSPESKYIQIAKNNPQYYKYINKRDIFPSDYFNGEWFLAQGSIGGANAEGHLPPRKAHLVKIQSENNKQSNVLQIQDISGDVESTSQTHLLEISIDRVSFGMNKTGDSFETFGEKINSNTEIKERDYLILNWNHIKYIDVQILQAPNRPPQVNIQEKTLPNLKIQDLVITDNYLSFTYSQVVNSKTEIRKVALLRKESVDTENFIPKKWFKDDQETMLGYYFISPQRESVLGETTEDEYLSHIRRVRFNTSLNTEEEKRSKTKLIKWYLSKDSVKDPEYMEIIKEAVRVWNQAFEIITPEGSEKKIRHTFVEGEEKDLGDLRFNIINLVITKDTTNQFDGWGFTYANPNTGQIISATANLLIDNILHLKIESIRHYIRYEIFRKYKNSEEENEIHAINSYDRKKIVSQCPEVTSFIKKSIGKNPTETLDDIHISTICAKRLAKEHILASLIHEIGHTVGLTHNFEGSYDKANFYTSLEEMDQLFPGRMQFPEHDHVPQASSVMDYSPVTVPGMTVPGKYDLAAIRYNYLDEFEDKDGKIIPVDIPENPDLQTSLKSRFFEQRKYRHCPDHHSEDIRKFFPCLKHDYGTSPEEITQYYMSNVKSSLNRRYRYDTASYDKVKFDSRKVFKGHLSLATIMYQKWIRYRDEYLNSTGQLNLRLSKFNDPEGLKNYQKALEEGFKNASQDYKDFYPVRNIVPDYIIDNLLFAKTMKCQVKDNETNAIFSLDIQSIIKTIIGQFGGSNHYVEDCYSQNTLDFLERDNNLTLLGQKGFENFNQYEVTKEKNIEPQVVSAQEFFINVIFGEYAERQFLSQAGFRPSPKNPWIQFFTEPDFLNKFRVKVEDFILGESDVNSELEHHIIRGLYGLFLVLATNGGSTDPLTEEIIKSNVHYLKSHPFTTDTGQSSIYKKIMEPVNLGGLSIEEIGIPFVTETWKAYQENKEPDDNFQNYLKNLDTTLNIESRKMIYLPYKKDSLIEKAIKRYNIIYSQIEDMNNRQAIGDLSEIEKIKLELMLRQLQTLIFVIDSLNTTR